MKIRILWNVILCEEAHFFKMLEIVHQTKWYHIPQGDVHHIASYPEVTIVRLLMAAAVEIWD